MYEDDPRFDALQWAYHEAKKDRLQNWNMESRIWQSACWMVQDSCAGVLREELGGGLLNDHLSEDRAILVESDGTLRKLTDPASMRAATIDEVTALANAARG